MSSSSSLLLLCAISLFHVCHGQQWPTVNKTNQNVVSPHTWYNADQTDQQIAKFAQNILQPLTIQMVKDTFQSSSNSDDSTISYQRLRLAGAGTFWQAKFGVPGVWIDLRSSVRGSYANGAPSGEDYAQAGVTYVDQQSITYTITYTNTLLDSYDIIHAHGVTAHDWRTDGVAFLSDMPLAPMESRNYSYTVPWNNSGTYFIHSHWSFNALGGITAPLVIVTDAPTEYPYAAQLNDANLVDAVMFLEDWCLQMTDADDAETTNPFFDGKTHREPYICQNPMLSFRAMWGEWNGDPAKKANQTKDLDNRSNEIEFPQCEKVIDGFEFDFAYHLANGRQYQDSVARKLQGGENVRLRIINSASLTTYRVIIPSQLASSAKVIAVDGHYITPASLPANNTLWIAVGQRLDVFFAVPTTQDITYVIQAVQETANPSDPSADGTSSSDLSELAIPGVSAIAMYTGNTLQLNTAPTPPITPGLLAKHPELFMNQEKSWQAWAPTSSPPGLGWTIAQADTFIKIDLNGYNGIRGINGRDWMLPPLTPSFTEDKNAFKVHSGDKVCLNITNWDHEIHPIHLHGHTFQVMAYADVGGADVLIRGGAGGAWRDTVQIPVCKKVVVCFNALAAPKSIHQIHCHMMVHEMSGMQATIQYEDYSIHNGPNPYTYTGALDAYTKGFNSNTGSTGGNNNNGSGTVINNYNNVVNQQASNTSDLTKTGLGVGLALGLALLFSWIFFGCAFFRYSQQHHYRPNMASDGRPSVSAPAGKQPAGMPTHELEEISHSRQ